MTSLWTVIGSSLGLILAIILIVTLGVALIKELFDE